MFCLECGGEGGYPNQTAGKGTFEDVNLFGTEKTLFVKLLVRKIKYDVDDDVDENRIKMEEVKVYFSKEANYVSNLFSFHCLLCTFSIWFSII